MFISIILMFLNIYDFILTYDNGYAIYYHFATKIKVKSIIYVSILLIHKKKR